MVETTILSEAELHAFIDGELDDARADAVAAIIAASPELSEQVERFVIDKDMIARAYGPLIEQPLPARLRQAVTGARPAPPANRPAHSPAFAGESTAVRRSLIRSRCSAS